MRALSYEVSSLSIVSSQRSSIIVSYQHTYEQLDDHEDILQLLYKIKQMSRAGKASLDDMRTFTWDEKWAKFVSVLLLKCCAARKI
ncbi:hypothetical protein DMENIID0001_078270 [Sergentomyia squamirostris]